jgi:hypothetical protein
MADAAASQTPHFIAIAFLTWSPHRLYRVYVRGAELFFIYLGSTIQMSPVTTAQFGLVGGLIGGALAAQAAKKRAGLLDQVEGMKDAPLEELLKLHKYNFSVQRGDLTRAALEPFGFWRRLTYRKDRQTGLFRFRHCRRGGFTLEFPTSDDLRMALNLLPAALGDVLQVRVAWDEGKNRFIPC